MHKNTQNALFVGFLLVAGVVSFQGITSALGYSASAQTLVESLARFSVPSRSELQGVPNTFDDHACPDKAQRGDYNCDDKVDYDDYTIFQRDIQRDETSLAPYFEWIRHPVFDNIPTQVPSPTTVLTQSPTQPPSTTTAATATPAPTSGGDINAHIQAAINKVEESSIKEHMLSIVDKDNQPGPDTVQTRLTDSSGNETEAEYIKAYFEQLGLETEYQPFRFGSYQTNNVIARIYGEDRNSWYIAMAHMDSTSEEARVNAPGADDNGSGTVAVMEMAKAIKQSGVPLKRSIEFILYSGEEQGLNGSYYYVSKIPASKKIIAALNFDMIGNKGSEPDCVDMNYKSRSGGNLITDTIVDVNREFSIGLKTVSQASTESRSDHYPFWQKNIVATFGHECEFSPVYHSTDDVPSYLSYSQITKATKAVTGALVKMSHEGQGEQLQLAQTDVLAAQSNRNQENGLQENSSQTAPILAYIPYSKPEDLDVLYTYATNFIAYLEEDYIETPVFLGLFTSEQVQVAQNAGFTVNVVDQKTDLAQYVYLYHPKAGMSTVLQSIGTPTEIAPRHYLVKLLPGTTFDHEGKMAQFFVLPLPKNEVKPAFAEQRITLAPTQSLSPVVTTSTPIMPKGEKGSLLPILLIIGLVIAGLIAYLILHKKAERTETYEA